MKERKKTGGCRSRTRSSSNLSNRARRSGDRFRRRDVRARGRDRGRGIVGGEAEGAVETGGERPVEEGEPAIGGGRRWEKYENGSKTRAKESNRKAEEDDDDITGMTMMMRIDMKMKRSMAIMS